MLGHLGLSVEQARRLLIFELNRKMEWYSRADDALWHKIRVMSSIIIQPHLKKAIKPEDLIKLREDVKNPRMTKEQIAEDVKRKTEVFLKRWRQYSP